jgi:hypothetical protein
MNRIILLILLNILVYYLYNKNIHLLISLFIFMIYYTLKMGKVIEGNYDFYKYNFANSLNDKVKTDREEGNLFNKIIRKLNSFLKRYMTFQEIPTEQPCVGRFNSWSECSRKCGRGEQFRTFNIIQKSGSGGRKCIYENGAIDKKECFNDICDKGDECDDDLDCDTGYCNPVRKQCGLEYECTKNTLYNCGLEDCEALGRHYHYDIEKGCDRYKLKNVME